VLAIKACKQSGTDCDDEESHNGNRDDRNYDQLLAYNELFLEIGNVALLQIDGFLLLL
jgi:hypothetical protein